MADNIIDFAACLERSREARVDRLADQATDIAVLAADALVKELDRFNLLMPDAISAQAMSIEATAMGAAQVALIAGRAEYERSGDVARARARFRLAIGCIKNSIDAYAEDVEASLTRDNQDRAS